jgi:hypothetical protein
MVERWILPFAYEGPEMEVSPGGAWVRFSDYEDLERQLAERDADLALKDAALEPFAWIGQWLFARDLPDDTPMVTIEGAGKPFVLTRGMFKTAHSARAALAAKDGQNG